MSDQFVAEIRIFPFNFPPEEWAFCNGQLLPIPQNTALFSLLGTTYGGNGETTFALPNLQGNAPLHPGQGPELSEYDLGDQGGIEQISLLESEIPAHSHTAGAQSSGLGGVAPPSPNTSLNRPASGNVFVVGTPTPPLVQMHPTTVQVSGGGLPHTNMQPYLALNFCIALSGVFPPEG